MGVVQVYSAERMLEIENGTVVSGNIDTDGRLILTRRDGSTFDAGLVYPISATTEVKGLVELATDAEILAGTDTTRVVTPSGLASLIATTGHRGLIEIANNTEVIAGTDTERAITPAGLQLLTATELRRGIVELATSAEVITGTDTSRAVSPAGLASLTATDSQKGLIEIATLAETLDTTDTERSLTPFLFASARRAGLQGRMPSSVTVSSGTASVAADGLVTFAGCGSISLNDVFDGLGADTYEMYFNVRGTTSNSEYIRLRNAGVDLSTSSYNRIAHGTYFNNGPSRSQAFPDTVLTYLFPYAQVPIYNARVTIFNPKSTSPWITQVLTESIAAASDRYKWSEYGQGPTGYSGFTLSGGGASMTGTIKVVKIG